MVVFPGFLNHQRLSTAESSQQFQVEACETSRVQCTQVDGLFFQLALRWPCSFVLCRGVVVGKPGLCYKSYEFTDYQNCHFWELYDIPTKNNNNQYHDMRYMGGELPLPAFQSPPG